MRWFDRGDLEAFCAFLAETLRISQTAYSSWLAAHTMTAGGRTLVTVEKEA